MCVCVIILLSLLLSLYSPVNSGSVQLDASNMDSFLANNDIVFLNFYADWCHFSQMLAPIWNEAAEKITSSSGLSIMGRIDCEQQKSICSRFNINKYPTLKYARSGIMAKKEYRGGRTVDAFVEFLKEQLKEPVQIYTNIHELSNIDTNVMHIIGYFKDDRKEESQAYKYFRRCAVNLKDDCQFHAGFGEASKQMHPPGEDIIVFRPNTVTTNELDETFRGDLTNYDALNVWVMEKCTSLVREITFENAEELTEEGLPFLILFYDPNDKSSIKKYTDIVKRDLEGEKSNVNFLTANGETFAHPLHHLQKSKADLPLIAIDSFRHMYIFPDFSEIDQPGKLLQFIYDLYSGKLHRKFHDMPEEEDAGEESLPRRKRSSTPPESQFQHLGPSKNRYTLLHDEF